MATPPLQTLDHTDTISSTIKDKHTANGLALILSNDYKAVGSPHLSPLPGAVHDGNNMESSLSELNYATCVEPNLSVEGTISLLRAAARYTKYPDTYKRIVIVFSGHGTSNQKLYANDGATFSIEEVVSLFSPKKTPHLGSIPKIFFIDACRGKRIDEGTYVPKGDAATARGGRIVEYLKVPSMGNCLIAYSTLPEHLSYEHKGQGGLWMSCLADKIVSVDKSITDVLIDVNQELMMRFNTERHILKDAIQQPECITRLNEPINFYAEANLQKNHASSTNSQLKHYSCSSYEENDENKSIDITPSLTATATWHPKFCQPPPQVLYPTKCSSNHQQKLECYCAREKKPMPQFKVNHLGRGMYIATVYVAKTHGRVKGEEASTKWEAQEAAAKTLLNILQV